VFADKSFDRILCLALLEAKSATDFSINIFREYKNLKPQVSLEAFARKGGFSSKTQVHYLITGQRKLTFNTLECLSKALSLQQKHKKILHLLVELEDKKDDKKEKELERLRNKLKNSSEENKNKNLCSEAIIKVFLALRKNSEFNTVEDIHRRTQLSFVAIQNAIKSLATNGYIEKNKVSESYILLREHLDLRDYGESEAFKKIFLSCLQTAQSAANNNFGRPESLFFNSFLTVKKSSLPELAKKLQDLLSDFANEHIDDEGEEVATLSTALHL
jgi:uncharacterized protein (TIGR02147 family)